MAIIIDKEPKSTSVKKGEDAFLDCVAHSSTVENAVYRCSWVKDNRVMFVGEGKRKQLYDWVGDYQSGNCSIMLKNVSVSQHRGNWRCEITNTESSDMEMATTIPVMVEILGKRTVGHVTHHSQL